MKHMGSVKFSMIFIDRKLPVVWILKVVDILVVGIKYVVLGVIIYYLCNCYIVPEF